MRVTVPVCNEFSDVFIDCAFKCCHKFRLQLNNIHGLCNGHYIPSGFMLLPGKSESIYRSICSAIRSVCERRDLPLEPTAVLKVAMHTVLNNAQCTFKTRNTTSCNVFQLA